MAAHLMDMEAKAPQAAAHSPCRALEAQRRTERQGHAAAATPWSTSSKWHWQPRQEAMAATQAMHPQGRANSGSRRLRSQERLAFTTQMSGDTMRPYSWRHRSF
jgi:hypothetical protein